MQNFINVCAFHFARGIVQFAMGGGIFLIAWLGGWAYAAYAAIHEDGDAAGDGLHDLGQRVEAGHGAVELAAAMVGQHHPVGPQVPGLQCVFHTEHAFDNQRSLPAATDGLQMAPAEVVAR